jgi:hypothetical protein
MITERQRHRGPWMVEMDNNLIIGLQEVVPGQKMASQFLVSQLLVIPTVTFDIRNLHGG